MNFDIDLESNPLVPFRFFHWLLLLLLATKKQVMFPDPRTSTVVCNHSLILLTMTTSTEYTE